MDANKLKNDILAAISQSISLLNEIPVNSTEDCRRKIMIHDNMRGIQRIINALQFSENANMNEGEDEHDDT